MLLQQDSFSEVAIPTLSALCPCESGLRAVRCCNLEPHSLAGPEATSHLVPVVERAIQAHRVGNTALAEKLVLEVLDLAPDRPGALLLLSAIRKAEGRAAAAEALIKRVVAFDPNNLAATLELAQLLLTKGAVVEAGHHARNAVRIAPENAAAHNIMGMVFTEANRPQVGEYHYRRVLALAGQRDPVVLANLASNLRNQGRVDEARALYTEALAAAPESLPILLGYARLEEVDRNLDKADEVVARIEQLVPGNPGARFIRAALLGRRKQPAAALALLDQADEGALNVAGLLEKGRLLDQLERYGDAWATFAAAKPLVRDRSGHVYRDAEAAQQVERLRRFFTADRLRLLPRATARSDGPQPIFVLGFPRSGTTLVEQTLSAHSAIAAGDELPLINELAAIMPRILASPLGYPEALSELWLGDQREGLDTLRDYYLTKVRQLGVLGAGKPLFTDKMPLNEVHLGLIALTFPEAPLLHVVRHPLDVMVSVFSNDFTHGLYCASDLVSAATHFVRVADLVESYRTEMTLRYLPIRYELLVEQQEAVVGDMLRFIGVPFEPACLTPHENLRYARTASYAQVAERLYSRSVFRYRHYLEQLQPAVPILQPVIERMGYRIDPPAPG